MFNDLDVIWVLVWEGETPSTNSLSQLETKDDSSLSDCQQPTVIFRTIAEFSAVNPLNCSAAGLNNLTQMNRLQLSTLSFGLFLLFVMPRVVMTFSESVQCYAWSEAYRKFCKKRKEKKNSRSPARKSVLMQQYDRWTICLTYGITVTEPLANVLLRHLNVHSGGEVFFPPCEAESGPHDCSHD